MTEGADKDQEVEYPAIVTVVVAYGSPDLLDSALAGLRPPEGEIPFSSVVVDNSSNDDVRLVASRAGAEYIDPGRNLGFAGGVNLGIEHFKNRSCDILLLNPDAVIDYRTVKELQVRLRQSPRLACVAPAQYDALGIDQQVVWEIPTPLLAWREAFRLSTRSCSRLYLVGSILLLRREALDSVGVLDDSFFLYAEECDWQNRALRFGWGVRLCPDLRAMHVGAGTSTSDPDRRQILFIAGLEHYMRKWHDRLGWQSFRLANILGSAMRVIVPRSRSRSEALNRLVIYVRGPRRLAARIRSVEGH